MFDRQTLCRLHESFRTSFHDADVDGDRDDERHPREDGDWPDEPAQVAWQRAAALSILANLGDRGGIKHELWNVDSDVRAEIIETLTEIIGLAYEQAA
ncbi:hypothetical protein [Mesorhizobium sp. A623]